MHTRHAFVDTTIGELLLVAGDDALTGLYFPDHRYPPAESEIGERVVESADRVIATAAGQVREIGERVVESADRVIATAAGQVREYLAGTRQRFDLSVVTHGDAFSQRVWALLREIPFGRTTTYGTLADELGNRRLAQRVGQAVGHNPVSIVIPCHRVVGADGSLTGFAGGLDRKRALLELEESEEMRAARLF